FSCCFCLIFLKHRQILLEIFSKNYRVRRNIIQNQLAREYGEDLDKQEVDKVLKDCCVSQGGMWYLKGTVQQPTS
ncbi:putative DNA-directed RNA polymerase III subunit RPC5-like protein, partial [Naja naja]